MNKTITTTTILELNEYKEKIFKIKYDTKVNHRNWKIKTKYDIKIKYLTIRTKKNKE